MRYRPAFVSLFIALGVALLALSPRGPAAEDKTPRGFAKDGVPFLQKHCYSCHGADKQKADLALHRYLDDASVLKDRRTWQNVLNMLQAGEMPPSSRKRPATAEVEAFVKAVNDVYVRAAKNPDPGRVTIRRLNRAEYNHTVRDLVGVDFQPAEDFPSDDVGHGFDNIGDVLSLSPILMERYLAAAENIMQRAILVDPPKPPVRHMSARYLEPAGPNVPQTRFRPVRDKDKASVNTPYNLSMDGEYIFKVKAYAETQPKDKEKVRIVLLMNGKELKTFDVTATEKNPTVYEAQVRLEPGNHRGAVVLLNPGPAGEKPRTLHVEYLELLGPLDTRPASHRRLLAYRPGLSPNEATREVLTRFATQAYRRPASADEIERLVKLAEKVMVAGEKWEAGIQLAMQAVLVSPKFLFRVELDDRPQTKEPHALDEYQLASRLSYFLWGSMPDDPLFELAGKKQLTANLEAQVRRMLQDPKAKALVDHFAMQWLQLRNLRNIQPDRTLFPDFDEPLRQAMVKETELFVEAVFREDRSILDLIDADFTFLNDRLARHYGLQPQFAKAGGNAARGRGSEFVRVSLQGTQRGGILTQASILTVTSNPTRTSPVKRGRWVLDQILGTPPPPPPPDVPELVENEKATLTGSLRQRMEQHRANPSCANCHARMDPIGFAFENFNAIGAFRAKDGDFAIDPAGTLPDGKTFQGPAELKALLKGKKELFSRCLSEKMLTYALGRGLEYYDQPTIDRVNAALARDGYKFSSLVIAIAKSDPFRFRRGKDLP